jgi:hypothetical protein
MAFFEEREETEEINYRRELKWFEDEFNHIFGSKTKLTERDRELAKMLKNKLFETINESNNKQLLGALVETLNKIEENLSKM